MRNPVRRQSRSRGNFRPKLVDLENPPFHDIYVLSLQYFQFAFHKIFIIFLPTHEVFPYLTVLFFFFLYLCFIFIREEKMFGVILRTSNLSKC